MNLGTKGNIPYWDSPPMQFSLSQTATLLLGEYKFLDASSDPLEATELNGSKNITESSLLMFYDVSFSTDIPILDYQQALNLSGTNDIPQFFLFLKSDAGSPQLKDPLLLQNYLDRQKYILTIDPKVSDNSITGFFRGKLAQTAALAGISTIDFTISFYVQEITDEQYIQAVKDGFIRGNR